MKRYAIVLVPDSHEDGYTVTVPALPWCITQGSTIEQCIERAHQAIRGYVGSLRVAGEQVPEEKEHPRMFTITIDI